MHIADDRDSVIPHRPRGCHPAVSQHGNGLDSLPTPPRQSPHETANKLRLLGRSREAKDNSLGQTSCSMANFFEASSISMISIYSM